MDYDPENITKLKQIHIYLKEKRKLIIAFSFLLSAFRSIISKVISAWFIQCSAKLTRRAYCRLSNIINYCPKKS